MGLGGAAGRERAWGLSSRLPHVQGALSLPSWAPLSAAAAGLPGRGGGAGAGGAAGPAAQAPVGAPPGAAGPPAGPWAGAEGLACLHGAWGSLRTQKEGRVPRKVCLQLHGYSLINLLQAHLSQNDKTCSRGPFLTSSPSWSYKAGAFNFILPVRKEAIYTGQSVTGGVQTEPSEYELTAIPLNTLSLQARGWDCGPLETG